MVRSKASQFGAILYMVVPRGGRVLGILHGI
jgi:hypothetical protein